MGIGNDTGGLCTVDRNDTGGLCSRDRNGTGEIKYVIQERHRGTVDGIQKS